MRPTLGLPIAVIVVCSTLHANLWGQTISLEDTTRKRCVEVLEDAFSGADFWPAMHAAEALTCAGLGQSIVPKLEAKLRDEVDVQHRCGLARELVRAGDRSHRQLLFDTLADLKSVGRVHAAESLYKVFELGDGRELRAAFSQTDDLTLRVMAAAALARSGNPAAFASLRLMLADGGELESRLAAWVLARIGTQADIAAIRVREEKAVEPLARTFFQHSLAALGDPAGKIQLLKNLDSADPATRTYAAVFAAEARILAAAERLQELLDDEHVDVRVRAAQALILLSTQPQEEKEVANLPFPATEKNPRYSEGSLLRLNNGELLLAVTEFVDSESDFAKAQIVARKSADNGTTWGDSRVLQKPTGKLNVMSVTLRRLRQPHEDTIAMFYLQKNAFDDLQVFVRFSTDEAATFGEAILVTSADGYHVMNNDRVTQLATGRLLVPVASTPNVKTVNHFVCRCWISDDFGRTWHPGKGAVDAPRRGAMEPEVVELTDGRLLMIVRTQLGYIGASYSSDAGETWSDISRLGDLVAPEAPTTIRRIPSTGDLMLVWNNTFDQKKGHGGRRTPLTIALSRDEGRTWAKIRDIETSPDETFAYTSAYFSRGQVQLTYYRERSSEGYSTQFRSFPVSRLYESE